MTEHDFRPIEGQLTRKRFLSAGTAATAALLAASGDAQGAGRPGLQQRRLAAVRKHMSTENRERFKQTLGTFETPRYEFIATGEIDNGHQAVAQYYNEMKAAFPDQRTSDWRIRYAPGEGNDRDAVVVEFLLTGTQTGAYKGIPPTGKEVSCRMTGFFFFPDGSDRLVDERVYFDAGTILMQLGVIAKLYPGWSGPLPR
jgi:predicted ester cyclase